MLMESTTKLYHNVQGHPDGYSQLFVFKGMLWDDSFI